jgi:hypothetical protein
MNFEEGKAPSPIIAIYQELWARHPKWYVEIGRPRGTGWIPGTALMTAREGPFQALLVRIGEQLYTADRRTIAASFAVRYGWSAGVAMGPYLLYRCVPKITLDNVSFKFNENGSFERAALHHPEGVMLPQDGMAPHPSIQLSVLSSTTGALLCQLPPHFPGRTAPTTASLDETPNRTSVTSTMA